MRKPGLRGFPIRSDTNRAVQLQKMARNLKFHIVVVEELYYLGSENKGADQLRGNHEADLRLCFRICEKPVSLLPGSFKRQTALLSHRLAWALKFCKQKIEVLYELHREKTAKLICIFVFKYSKSWFSHDAAHILTHTLDYIWLCLEIRSLWLIDPHFHLVSLYVRSIMSICIFSYSIFSL